MSRNTVGLIGEKSLLGLLRPFVAEGNSIVRAFSEDCAVLDAGSGRYRLLTMDVLVEGEHFIGDWTPAYYLGRKAVNVNVSDISAMGGKAKFFLVSLGLPPETPVDFVKEMYRGFASAAKQSNLLLAGGNVSASRVFFVDILMEGEVDASRVLMRNGARPGDVLYVSGSLGAAAAGLLWLQRGFRILQDSVVGPDGKPAPKHVSDAIFAHFDPPVLQKEGDWLSSSGHVTSMMDLSDGLASDLPELCRESHVGASLKTLSLPIASFAVHTGADPVQLALRGGEDYHLLFTVSGSRREQFEKDALENGVSAHAIGTIVPESEGILCHDSSGNSLPLGSGFQHFGRS